MSDSSDNLNKILVILVVLFIIVTYTLKTHFFRSAEKTKRVWEISLSLSGSQPPTSVGSNF